MSDPDRMYYSVKLESSPLNSPAGTIGYGYHIHEDKRSERKHFPDNSNSERTNDPEIVNEQSDEYKNEMDQSTEIAAAGTLGYTVVQNKSSERKHFPDNSNSERSSDTDRMYYSVKLDSSPLNSPTGTTPQIDEGKRSERKHFPDNSNSERTNDPEIVNEKSDEDKNEMDQSTEIAAAGTLGYTVVQNRSSERKHFPDNSNSERSADPEVLNEKSDEENISPNDDEDKVDPSTEVSAAGTLGYTIVQDIRSERKHFHDKNRSTIFNDN